MSEPRPYPVYLFINGAFALCFMLYATIASVYRIQTVGLNPLQLVFVGTVLELAVLTFEVPTGVLADTYSRRLSVIIGFFLIESANGTSVGSTCAASRQITLAPWWACSRAPSSRPSRCLRSRCRSATSVLPRAKDALPGRGWALRRAVEPGSFAPVLCSGCCS